MKRRGFGVNYGLNSVFEFAGWENHVGKCPKEHEDRVVDVCSA